MSNILNIGKTALLAAQIGIETTGHNISNAKTAGYSRQIVVQGAVAGQDIGVGYVGKGTEVLDIRRVFNDFTSGQVRASQTSYSQLNTYYNEVQQIDNMLSDSTVGLSPSLQSFFSGVQDLSSTASGSYARQSLLSSASALVSQFNSVSQRLTEISEGVNSQITASVTKINAYAVEISKLNDAIERAVGQSDGVSMPNDLLDQRDQLVAELSKEIRVSVVKQGNSYNVFIGNGQTLVNGGDTYSLVSTPSATDQSRMEVGYKNPDGSTTVLTDNLLSGGNLTGLLTFRSETLDVAQNSIGRIATVLASTFNAQHSLGQDLNGNMGRDIVGLVATADNATTASVTPTIVDAKKFANSGYRLSYNAGNFTLTRLSDNVSWSDADWANLQDEAATEGFKFTVSDTMSPGDSFSIAPTYGSGFFNVADPLVTASARNDASSTAVVSATIGDATKLTTSDYQLTYDDASGKYTLMRLSDKTLLSSSATLADVQTAAQQEGFNFTIAGTPANGDSFLIRPTANGASGLSLAITDASKIAAGSPIIAASGYLDANGHVVSSNTGSGVISSYSVKSPMIVSEATLRETVTIKFTAEGKYDVVSMTTPTETTLASNQTYTEGGNITYNGWTIQLTGTPKIGDKFTVSTNASGVGDNRNAKALGNLQTTNLVEGSKTTFQGAYSQLVNLIGNKTSELEATSAAAKTLYTSAYTAQQSESGVNLDEEAANLLHYQQAYQAAAKIMQIAGTLFDSLLAIGA